MITRRSFGMGLVAGSMGMSCRCGWSAPTVEPRMGCHLVLDDGAGSGNVSAARESWSSPANHRRSSGDPHFDFALAHTLSMLVDTFQVLPGFRYFEEEGSPNALATSVPLFERPDGAVLFGIKLLDRFHTRSAAPTVAVATVCAHEFAHILQYKRGLTRRLNAGQPTVKRSELQADYLAGYFTGLRKLARKEYPAAEAALTQFNFGDTAFHHPDHHGTHEERGAAVQRGFNDSYRLGKNLEQVVEDSTRYVMALEG